jgi:polyphosphate kinase
MADTVKARLQQPDGSYLRANKVIKDAPLFSSQEFLMKLAEGKAELNAIPVPAAAKSIKKVSRAKAEAAD